ncbi:hypothetical protein PbB2_01540 [Candidatus Phycosocius bacilliformis]|uniref:DUF1343 domain-containing protein n=1 Tax=Candidatus Phycosocius bacilliformis TaxID=1445552 RepID=A0A2P2E9X5_9PROT|nr:DUF1343 domain-containing protein [Candidatus Phycosocius bacilliformis]GBF57870.1 hypothetical protein PbB2_01540 [Candidatus Phycosocius bacilliformis]
MDRRSFLQVGAVGAAKVCMAGGLVGAATPARAWPLARKPHVMLGIDRLAAENFTLLAGKRVGFITNQTSVDQSGAMSRVVLQRGLGSNLTALFGPEHGLDTRAKAGDHVDNARDPVTGLTAFSLYGQHRKPTPDMLSNVDVLVFDIQDIGVRSYTYISTMILAMEACGEAGKEFVVLDRPNPMGGALVQGPPLLPGFQSFVSQVPVPYLHGLTIGELAQMAIAKSWVTPAPKLTVVEMAGWQRAMNWAATGLGWVPTSPNIPHWQSPYYCATTGILGELKQVDIGIGTRKPFHFAAGPGINGRTMASDLTRLGLRGLKFRPYRSRTKRGFGGVEVLINPNDTPDLMPAAMALCAEVVARSGKAPLTASPASTRSLFDKVYGSQALWQTLTTDASWQDLVTDWASSLTAFETERRPFLLYN